MDKYRYPFIITFKDDKIAGNFPDLPGCIACGETEDELLKQAYEALALHIYGMEEDGDEIPTPSKIRGLQLEPNQYIVIIEVWMPPFRDEMQNKAVKKTLTIPKWLDDIAEERNVNFSHILQNALKKYLGVENGHRE